MDDHCTSNCSPRCVFTHDDKAGPLRPCPRCDGQMVPSMLGPGEYACLDCPYATYDDDVAGQQAAWDAYAEEVGQARAEELLGARPSPGRREHA